MARKKKSSSPIFSPTLLSTLLLLIFLLLPPPSTSQQLYTNNEMLNCYNKNTSSTLGYACSNSSSTCDTYLLFRSQPNYNTPSQIAYFLNASTSEIASLNGVTDVFIFPTNHLVLVPITCSCDASTSTSHSQHDAYYTLKFAGETYLFVANNTFQGLSTCQAMMAQNPDHDSYNLTVGLRLKVPLRCACPGKTQTDKGYNFLLTYVVKTGDTYPTIAEPFGVVINDMLAANSLEGSDTIYPHTTLLLPLKTVPTVEMLSAGNPPSPSPGSPPATPSPSKHDDQWAIIIGVIVGAFFVGLCGLGVFFLCFRRRRKPSPPERRKTPTPTPTPTPTVSSEARATVGSLTAYSYSDLHKATGGFNNVDRSDSSVFHGTIDGDSVAVKRVKGDGSEEIKILQRLNHISLARLCGFCVHEGHSYLVYDFAENGSLADWMDGGGLGWRKRVTIACELADGLNYLHNYAKPPCVHKDLTSRCVLLDGEFRVKLANFGLARSVSEDEDATPQQTWHVVGTMGLSTCQAMIQQNPDKESRNLTLDTRLKVPLRCACPSMNQTISGFKFLLTYSIITGDDLSTIAERFNTNLDDVLVANQIDIDDTIYPYSTILVPIKTSPTKDMITESATPSPASPPQITPTDAATGSDVKWIIIGVVVGVCFIGLSGLLVFYVCFIHRKRRKPLPVKNTDNASIVGNEHDPLPDEARSLVGSLAVYKYEDLHSATEGFDEARRIGGSVYRGTINGDIAAVKRMVGDVSNEIKILRQLNHTNLVCLSGFCIHEGHTYLVYEFAEKGSLANWLHKKFDSGRLSWKQRVNIAHEVAEGLNYLHNYTKPSCVHKDLTSSNVLLDAEFRVKLANFGLARAVVEDDQATPQQTLHVVGTQGYMPPEYLQHGVITAKIDVFAFGVLLLELISGKEAIFREEGQKDILLSSTIEEVMDGEGVMDKLKNFLDPTMVENAPIESVFNLAQLARRCVTPDPVMRPTITKVLVGLSAIQSCALDSNPSS